MRLFRNTFCVCCTAWVICTLLIIVSVTLNSEYAVNKILSIDIGIITSIMELIILNKHEYIMSTLISINTGLIIAIITALIGYKYERRKLLENISITCSEVHIELQKLYNVVTNYLLNNELIDVSKYNSGIRDSLKLLDEYYGDMLFIFDKHGIYNYAYVIYGLYKEIGNLINNCISLFNSGGKISKSGLNALYFILYNFDNTWSEICVSMQDKLLKCAYTNKIKTVHKIKYKHIEVAEKMYSIIDEEYKVELLRLDVISKNPFKFDGKFGEIALNEYADKFSENTLNILKENKLIHVREDKTITVTKLGEGYLAYEPIHNWHKKFDRMESNKQSEQTSNKYIVLDELDKL